MTVRIAMWSGPRNLSTATTRAWENRRDTIGDGQPGPVTKRLAADHARLTAISGTRLVQRRGLRG